MSTDPSDHFPRSKDELLRDFEVASRLHDIREATRLKEQLAPRWWEAAVGMLQFAAALGLLAAVVAHPATAASPPNRLLAFFLTLMILSLVFGFEMLILRLHHLRRANEFSLHMIEDLSRRLAALEEHAAPATSATPSPEPDPAVPGCD